MAALCADTAVPVHAQQAVCEEQKMSGLETWLGRAACMQQVLLFCSAVNNGPQLLSDDRGRVPASAHTQTPAVLCRARVSRVEHQGMSLSVLVNNWTGCFCFLAASGNSWSGWLQGCGTAVRFGWWRTCKGCGTTRNNNTVHYCLHFRLQTNSMSAAQLFPLRVHRVESRESFECSLTSQGRCFPVVQSNLLCAHMRHVAFASSRRVRRFFGLFVLACQVQCTHASIPCAHASLGACACCEGAQAGRLACLQSRRCSTCCWFCMFAVPCL
jgi:hypothetical protein